MLNFKWEEVNTLYCKFYIAQFKNKVYEKPKDGKLIIKFGITHHTDALKRFDENVDDGYTKNYEDWEVKIIYSQNFLKVDAWECGLELEKYVLFERFPPETHKVWIEDYLNIEDKHRYDNTGITEYRLLAYSELQDIINELGSTLSEEELRLKAEKRKQLENTS
jgi:hypothetical protein